MSETKNKTCQFKSKYARDYKCPEPPLEDSDEGYCIFHEPTKDKSIEKFNKGIKRKLHTKDYKFIGYWFPATFSLEKPFTFEKWAHFTGSIFEGKVDFEKSVFQAAACFTECVFREEVRFIDSTFQGEADFRGSTFEGEAIFLSPIFTEEACFRRCTFENEAYFVECSFKGEADFTESTFKAYARFTGSIFQEKAIFAESTFHKDADFTCTSKTETHFTKSIFQEGVDFRRSIFEKVILLDDVKINWSLESAEVLFRKAKILWHQQGNYVEEGKAHYQEMDYIRKQKRWDIRYIWANLFHRLLHGYGEKPHRVILGATTIITVCALLFMNFGIGETRLFGKNLPTYNIFKMLPKFYTLSLTDLANIGRYFYFSVVTFTTLGYGDLRPVHPISHLISSIEAFTGMFMMALFVLTYGRKWRR